MGRHRRYGGCVAAAAISATLVLASCAGPDTSESKNTEPESEPKNSAAPPESATEGLMANALDRVVQDIGNTEDCDEEGGKVKGQTLLKPNVEGKQHWRPTAAGWMATKKKQDTATSRPKLVGELTFCTTGSQGESYQMYVHGFESEKAARAWFDELEQTTANEPELDPDTAGHDDALEPPSTSPLEDPECAPVGTQRSPESTEAPDGAIDVMLEYPCVPENTEPFDYDPTILTTSTSGPWVMAVTTTRSGGMATAKKEGVQARATKYIRVQPDAQAAVLASMAQELNKPVKK